MNSPIFVLDIYGIMNEYTLNIYLLHTMICSFEISYFNMSARNTILFYKEFN